jgi:hypothetical protein
MSGTRRPSYRDVRPVVDLVTDEEMYEAMQYIDTVAHDFAVAVADFDRADYRVRMAEAAGVMTSKEPNAARQQADARTSPHYLRTIDARYEAQMRLEEIKARRVAAQLKIEVWRTIHADKRIREVPPDYREREQPEPRRR